MQYEPKAVAAAPDKPISELSVGDTFVASRETFLGAETVGAFTVKKVTNAGFVHARGRDLVEFVPRGDGNFRAVPRSNSFPMVIFKGGTGVDRTPGSAWSIDPKTVRAAE